MKLKRHKFLKTHLLIGCMLYCFVPVSTFATGLSSIDNKTLIHMEKVYSESGPGLDFTVVGKSLLVKQTIQKISTAPLKISCFSTWFF